MSQERRSTLRAQWLGQQMRQAREANGLTMGQAAEFLGRDSSGISRFETGSFPLAHRDVEALLSGLYQVDEQLRLALLKLSEDVWRTDWWDGYASEVDQSFIDYVWLESRATEIRSFCISALDGLLQTSDYAHAVIKAAAQPETSEAQIERWVELRLQRQAVLGRRRPPHLAVVADEALLHRVVGSPEVLAAQLRHLVDQASRPHIEIRVLPAESGAHASPSGEFRIFSMADPHSEVVCVDCPAGQIFLEPPRTDRLVATYRYLQDDALDPDASIERLEAVADEQERR